MAAGAARTVATDFGDGEGGETEVARFVTAEPVRDIDSTTVGSVLHPSVESWSTVDGSNDAETLELFEIVWDDAGSF